MAFEAIQAQAGAVTTLTRALDHDRVAHAYLFEGPSGVGKQKAALALACAQLCPQAPKRGCGSCQVCQRILGGTHPDVRVFAPRDEGNRNIQVEQVREEILPFCQFAPFEAPCAWLIFPEADISFPDQHAEAANALLKTLEEPRANVRFCLLSERPERLLPTIRSRCQVVRFAPLPRSVLMEILRAQGVDETALAGAAALSFGRADRALMLASDNRAERLLSLAIEAEDATRSRRAGRIVDAADALAGDDERGLLLDTLALLYRDIASAAVLGEGAELAFPQRAEWIHERARTLGADGAAWRHQAIEAANEAMILNANPETTLDAMLLSFA